MKLPEAYRRKLAKLAACPIELGAIGALADTECRCGRLPGDPTPICGCWPQEPMPRGVKPRRQLVKPYAIDCRCGCGTAIIQKPGRGAPRLWVNNQHRQPPTGRPVGRPRKHPLRT